MRVKLKFPWRFVDSPYYESLMNNPPKDVEFVGVSKNYIKVIDSSKLFIFQKKVKTFLRKAIEVIKIPNITFTTSPNADLIHCAHCLLLNNLPWVVDVEHYWTFSASSNISYSKFGKFIIKKILRKNNCKKILPWTNAAGSTIKDALKDREINRKIEVVYPAIPVPKLRNIKKPRKITLLFIGRYFYPKGGLFVLEAFKKLKQKYDLRCIVISLTIPDYLKERYRNLIEIYNSVSEDVLFNKIYPSSDIFVYPGFSDTFGFSLLEAMSFGIPIVTVDAFARKEIVENGRNGFVIERPNDINIYRIGEKERKVINEIVEKASILIESSSLRRKMGKYGRMLVEKGRFSIKERNKKLRKIYEEASKK
jgi:glycosyltransferase involved in cell wall biosynthesis